MEHTNKNINKAQQVSSDSLGASGGTNSQDFEKLMEDSSTNKENYYDKNNPVVRVILLVLGGIIVVGAAYYIMTYLGTR